MSTAASGLSRAQAARRLQQHGPNELFAAAASGALRESPPAPSGVTPMMP